MDLKELLEYDKELITYINKVRNQKARQVFASEKEQLDRNLLRNSGKYSLNVWIRIFQEEIQKQLGTSMVLRTFHIKHEKKSKSGEIISTYYNTYICLIKNRAKILTANYSPEFLEYLLATKFKQTYNGRIIDHKSGYASEFLYNFTDLPKKLVGNRTYLESRKELKNQVNAIIKRDSLVVLDTYSHRVEPNQTETKLKYTLNGTDYKHLKNVVSILPTSKQYFLNKKFKLIPKTPEEVMEKVIFNICDRQLNKNEKDKNQFSEKLDFEKILGNNKKDYEFSMFNR